MAISVVSSGGFLPATSNGVATFTMPTVAAGDCVFIFSSAASSTADISTITGLSVTPSAVGTKASFSGHESGVFLSAGLGTGDSGATVTATLTNTTIRHSLSWIVLRGAHATTPVDGASSAVQSVASASPATPSRVTVADGCVELSCVAQSNSTTAITAITPPVTITSAGGSYPTLAAGTTANNLGYGTLAGVAAGATIGSRTWTSDQSKPYSVWTVAVKPIPTLTPPTGLVATPLSASDVGLSWNSVALATGYEVERDGAVIASPTGTTYSDTGLSPATLYTYRVRSVN